MQTFTQNKEQEGYVFLVVPCNKQINFMSPEVFRSPQPRNSGGIFSAHSPPYRQQTKTSQVLSIGPPSGQNSSYLDLNAAI